MAYDYVSVAESNRYRSDCSNTLKRTCAILKKKGISATFTLVGSGARNLITRNGDGPYDLDYNLNIVKAEYQYWRDLKLLKETIRISLNKAIENDWFSDAQDSTSCLTTILHFNDSPDVEFSFDVAIVTRDDDGVYHRLIHNKNAWGMGMDQYVWNIVPNSRDVGSKAQELKNRRLWADVRKVYLEKKNRYLRLQDHSHPSFIVYVETINEVYRLIM